MSDLHLEFQDMGLEYLSADIVVLAGDIHVGTEALEWIKRELPTVTVLYVPGNHEFYSHEYSLLRAELQELTKGTNVHVLDNHVYSYYGVNFFGSTLWTDFTLFGDREKTKRNCGASMNDYRLIQDGQNRHPISPERVLAIHQESLVWLDRNLGLHAGEKNVVITHHGPSIRSVAPEYSTHPLTPAFVSDLEGFIKKHKPHYWIHGHVHNSSSYEIQGCKVRVNTRGYPSEPSTGFNPTASFDI